MSIGKYHYNYIKSFMKNCLSDIEIINGVPKVVFIFWFSHKDYIPTFTVRRFNALKSLIENINVPVIIITNENYKNWILEEFPLNENFNNLSGVHKSDYLRVYLLYHYGGGYHDIKWREKSWENEWDKFQNKNIWFIGRREIKESHIAYNPNTDNKNIQKRYNDMITFGWIISKPKNECLKLFIIRIEEILNNKSEALKLNPAPKSRCGIGVDCDESKYPVRWLELLCEIFHPLMLNYIDHINYTLPDIVYKNYK